jgi:hypothetical protein
MNQMGKMDFYDVSCDTIHINVFHLVPPSQYSHGVLSISFGDKVFCDIEALEKNMEFLEQFRQVKTIRIDTRFHCQGRRPSQLPDLVKVLRNKVEHIWFVVDRHGHDAVEIINSITRLSKLEIKKITFETVGIGQYGPPYNIVQLRERWRHIEFVESTS